MTKISSVSLTPAIKENRGVPYPASNTATNRRPYASSRNTSWRTTGLYRHMWCIICMNGNDARNASSAWRRSMGLSTVPLTPGMFTRARCAPRCRKPSTANATRSYVCRNGDAAASGGQTASGVLGVKVACRAAQRRRRIGWRCVQGLAVRLRAVERADGAERSGGLPADARLVERDPERVREDHERRVPHAHGRLQERQHGVACAQRGVGVLRRLARTSLSRGVPARRRRVVLELACEELVDVLGNDGRADGVE